jgi:pimeloyl-ACP methyl ester carboxylesterase
MRARTARIATSGALGALAVYSGLRYRRDIRAARQRVSEGSRIVRTPCGPIEYADAGQGPPVLLVHGAGGGWDQGLDFGRPLAARGFRVVAMSRFGYLRTPLPTDASAAAQADAHAALLDALGIGRTAILGASAGAPSAMQFALRHPDRCAALVLVVPAAYVPRPGNAPPLTTPKGTAFLFDTALRSDFLFWSAIRLARRVVIRSILATPAEDVDRASPAEKARVRMMLQDILPVSSRRLGLLNDAAVTSSLPRYDLERIGAPTLVMSVRDDLFGTWDAAKYTAEHVPKARFVGYPSGGHVWVGHEEEGLAEIAAFLRDPSGGR